MEKEERVLQEFFYNPMKRFGVRELSRITHLDTKTVMKYLRILASQKIIVKKKEEFAYYEANRLSPSFRLRKSNFLTNKIAASGLIDYLEDKLKPKALILFGSVQKGTYLEQSDVDIFVQGKELKINLGRFEKSIGHEINLLFEEDLNRLSEGLRNNINSGNRLLGRLEI